MSVGFGFSVGDIVSSINLVRDVAKALQGSKGSSKEYLEVIVELRNLELALREVKSLYDAVQDNRQTTLLRQAVGECENLIDDFLQGLEKYHGHLSLTGTKSKFKDALRKVQWALCTPDQLNTFRLKVAAHIRTLQVILATAKT
jgi:hypothetical protein